MTENKLSKIVPPYQLCKLIPARCFTDSYAVYPCYLVTYDFGDNIPKGPYHRVGVPVTREYWNDVINKCVEPCVTKYIEPAPTLEEILREFKSQYVESTPTSAPEALELWLKLKGIKDEHL